MIELKERNETMLEKLMSKIIKYSFEKDFVYKPLVNDITGIYDIAYGENECHKMDVYYPKYIEISKLPVIFYIHGGAWVACNKETNRAYSEYLASFGYCVVNMDYRLLPKTDIKGQVQDVVKAILYFDKEVELEVNKKDYILMGDSAGAHMASLIYCLMCDTKINKNFSTQMKALPIKALVLQNMVSDLSDITNSNKLYLKLMTKLLFGKDYKHSPLLHQASFLEVVNEKTIKIPVILVGSEHDPLYQQTHKMKQYLIENDWEYTDIIWTKNDRSELGHVFQVNNPLWEESKITHQKIFAYLKEILNYEN